MMAEKRKETDNYPVYQAGNGVVGQRKSLQKQGRRTR